MSKQSTRKTVSDIKNADTLPTKAEQTRVDEHNQSKIQTVTVTAETIVASIAAGVGALGAAFHEPEQRVLADNGKAYPLDASLPDGVSDTGSIVVRNRYQFLQSQLLGCVCWKLETMLADCTKRLDEQRGRIKSAVYQLEAGRGGMTEQVLDRLADFAETLIEQQAMLNVAYLESMEAYTAATGEEFETAEMRRERQTSEAALKKANPARAARLAALGVK